MRWVVNIGGIPHLKSEMWGTRFSLGNQRETPAGLARSYGVVVK
jgi:hypothetical protein